MTDAFTKYAEMVAIPNKESFTVATAIFEKWVCRFGVPLEIITDQGKEFCAKLTKDLFQLLQITHSTTSAYHPQCNSQAEVANKTIAKYLTSYVSDTTLDWEDYLAPMMFSYNTSFHRSVQNTPFFLTHGMEARQPTFDAASNRIRMEGPKPSQEIMDRLYEARQRAINANQDATASAREYHDRKAEPHHYHRDQLVLLQDPYYLNRNAKMAPKWTGPHRIEQLKGDCDVSLKLASGRKLTAHVDRLKPYHQKNEPEVIPDDQEAYTQDYTDDEEHMPPPQIPPTVPPPQPPLPPRSTNQVKQKIIQPQLIQPHLLPRRSPRFSNVSALQKPPTLKILTGEGVQKVEVQKTLISQSKDKVSWAAVITETRHFHPAQEGSELDWSDYNRRQAIADANYLATGDPLFELLGINEVLIEWEESVPSDQPPGQVAPPVPLQIRNQPGPVALRVPQPGPVAPRIPQPGPVVPQPGPSTGARARPQRLPGPVTPKPHLVQPALLPARPGPVALAAAARPSTPDSSESDNSNDPDYTPSTTPPSSPANVRQFDGLDDSIYEDCFSEGSGPSTPTAPVYPSYDYQAEDEYVEIPLREHETFEEFNRRCDEQEAALRAAAQAAAPKPKASGLGALFNRSSRSRQTLPASVLSQYPDERRQPK